jgi:hypothetical protein
MSSRGRRKREGEKKEEMRKISKKRGKVKAKLEVKG